MPVPIPASIDAMVELLRQGDYIADRSLALSDGAEPERFAGGAVTWDLFPALGVPPALGRHFNPEDDRTGAEPVVMLSDDVWQRRYHGDRGIISRDRELKDSGRVYFGLTE